MWMRSRVVAVVPARDEAPRIGRVVREMPEWVDAVIVIDDGSRDATANAALESGDGRVEVIRHEASRGVGAAIVSGYRRAAAVAPSRRDVFVVMAGDGQMDPRDLPAVVTPVARGEADYVKGNRFLSPATARTMPLARRLGGLVFSRMTSFALGTRVDDSQCGYTAIAREALLQLDLDRLWPGYGYPNDLLSQIVLRGLRVRDAPVRAVYADEVSRLRPRHVPLIAAVVARSWVRRLRARRLG
ncbi:MAG: glycosyltransferase family 2 protein [Polyangiaceae bacterium]